MNFLNSTLKSRKELWEEREEDDDELSAWVEFRAPSDCSFLLHWYSVQEEATSSTSSSCPLNILRCVLHSEEFQLWNQTCISQHYPYDFPFFRQAKIFSYGFRFLSFFISEVFYELFCPLNTVALAHTFREERNDETSEWWKTTKLELAECSVTVDQVLEAAPRPQKIRELFK